MLLCVNPVAANTEQAQDLSKYFDLSFSSLIVEHPGRSLCGEENRSGATSVWILALNYKTFLCVKGSYLPGTAGLKSEDSPLDILLKIVLTLGYRRST